MVVGIEIASDAVRAVCLDRFRRDREQDSLAETPCRWPNETSGLADALSDALGRLKSLMDLGRSRLAVAIPTSWCFLRIVSFPYRSSVRIAGTFRFALEERLPGRLDDYVVAPVSDVLPAGDAGGRLLAAACAKDRLAAILQAFRQQGLAPCVVQPAGVAVGGWLREFGNASAGAVWAVRFSAGECEAIKMASGNVLAAYALPLHGLDPSRPEDCDPIAERLRSTVRAHTLAECDHAAERLLLLSTDAEHAALAGPLATALGLPVERPAVPAQTPWLAALGVAADAASRGNAAHSLRVGEFAYAPYARRSERLVAAALLLLAGLAGLWGVQTWNKEAAARAAVGRLKAEEARWFRQVVDKGQEQPTLARMRAAVAQARREADRPSRPRLLSCLQVWVDLMGLVPRDLGVQFTLIDVDQNRVAVEARVPNVSNAWKLRQQLEASKRFQPDPPVVARTPSGHYATFSMELKYRR